MKIITWNCNMAFRKKAHLILQHQPHILIVQECEHPDKLKFTNPVCQPTDILWFGDNKNKGLGIFSFGGIRLKQHQAYNPAFKIIVPIQVQNGSHRFILYAVWANNPGDSDGQYITQVWKAMAHYKRIIRKKNTILAGDFNSNTIWDKPRREGNHSHLVKRLQAKGICSLYHQYFGQQQGTEAHPTFYLYKNKQKPYHLDYCFASDDFASKLLRVTLGSHRNWTAHSDHMPLIAEFDIPVK